MKKRSLWLLMLMFAGITVSAQVSKDSVNILKNEKEKLKIAKSLNENKLKLADLENQVSGKNSDIQKANDESEKAARDNQKAADELNGDPLDKGKAKRAKKAASYAESSAKKARKAQDKLQDLNKDIENLRNKIAKDEEKLNGMGGISSTPQQ